MSDLDQLLADFGADEEEGESLDSILAGVIPSSEMEAPEQGTSLLAPIARTIASPFVEEDDEPINENEYVNLGWLGSVGEGVVNNVTGLAETVGNVASGTVDFFSDAKDAINERAAEGQFGPVAALGGFGDVVSDRLSSGGEALAGATSYAMEDPGGALRGAGRIAAPVIGGVAFNAPGVVLAPTVFEEILSFGEYLTGLDMQDRSREEVLEGLGGSLTYGAVAKGVSAGIKNAGRASKGTAPGQQIMGGEAARREAMRTPEKALAIATNKVAREVGPKALEASAKAAMPRLSRRLSALELADDSIGALKEGTFFTNVRDIITRKVDGKSLLDEVAGEVDDTLASVKKSYKLRDAKNFYERGLRERLGNKTFDRMAEDKAKSLAPFEIAISKKIAAKRLNNNPQLPAQQLRSYRRQVQNNERLLKGYESGGKEAMANGGWQRYQAIAAQQKSLKSKLAELESEFSKVTLTPKEFWEAQTNIPRIRFQNFAKPSESEQLANSVRGAFRKKIQDDFKAQLKESPDTLARYLKSNEEFSGLKRFKDLLNDAENIDAKVLGKPRSAIASSLRRLGVPQGIIGERTTHSAVDYFKGAARGLKGDPMTKGIMERVYSRLSKLPGKGEWADDLAEVFSTRNVSAFGLAAEEIEQTLMASPVPIEDAERVVDAVAGVGEFLAQNQGLPEAAQLGGLKSVARDKDMRALLPFDEQSPGLMEGVDSFGGRPLSAQDVETYKRNMDKAGLNSLEQGKRVRHLNQEGRFMPEPIEEEPEVDTASLDKQAQIQAAREEMQPLKSSSQMVKKRNVSFGDRVDKRPELSLVSFKMDTDDEFEDAFNLVLDFEGGFYDDPRGGRTNLGVTQSTYNKFLKKKGEASRDVADIDESEAREIYKQFWDESRAGQLPYPLNMFVFDAAINSGSSRAVKQLQTVLGVKRDGRIGPETLDAVDSMNTATIAQDFLAVREEFYKKLNDPTHEKGWLNRVKKLRKLIRRKGPEMAIA